MTRAKKEFMAVLTGMLLLVTAQAAQAATVAYANYTSDDLGFSCQIPAHWLPPQIKPPATLLFAGPQDSEQYYTTINAQLVRADNSNLDSQAQEFLGQMSKSPRYRLLARQSGKLAGQRGLRMVVEYQLPGTNQLFRQEQFVAERPPYYFWLAYTAPVELFDKHQAIMAQAVASLIFKPFAGGQPPAPAAQAPPQAPAQPPAKQATQVPAPPAAQPPQGDPASRVFDLRTASGINDQDPVGVSQVFPQDIQRIYVWFRYRDLAAGSELRSEWFFSEQGSIRKMAEASTKVPGPSASWGQFNLSISPGGKFPVGQYRVDVYVGPQLQGSAFFQVR